MKSYDTIIVGGGAAGMAAAIACSQVSQRILILDRLDKLGKKILVTGNGHCNLTNLDQKPEHYRSDEPEKAWDIINRCNLEDTYSLFSTLGLVTRNRDGYVYPYNEQASSVREAFEEYLKSRPGLDILLETDVQSIHVTKAGRFRVCAGKDQFTSDYLVIATGGMAGNKLGCDGTGYQLLKSVGHKVIPVNPALTALKSKAPFLKKLSGVRNKAEISLKIDGNICKTETGELQWTDYGISGVAIFQLSRYAVRALEAGQSVSLELNFMPDYSKAHVGRILHSLADACPYKDGESLLKGIFPAKIAPVILREARLSDVEISIWNEDMWNRLITAIRQFSLRICGYMGYDKAQVTSGGISLSEVSEDMESNYAQGLYIAGEVADVDGTCGGYNLQWAWSSGTIAGRAIARQITKNKKGCNF